jgi:hypothetical protein
MPSALKREHPALQKMKFIKFSIFVGNVCPTESGCRSPMDSGYGSESTTQSIFTSAALVLRLLSCRNMSQYRSLVNVVVPV